MKIFGLSFRQSMPVKNNQSETAQNPQGFLTLSQPADEFCKSKNVTPPSFTAKIREDQISRDPLVKLYEEGLPCFCCGRKMIPPRVIEEMRTSHVFRCTAPEAIEILSQYEDKMHTNEKKVFNILKEEVEKDPSKSIKEHLLELKKTHELPLIQKQAGIFKLIDKFAEKIKPELHQEIRDYLLTSFETIKNNGNEFSRVRFIKQLEKILENYPNTQNKEKLIRIAGKLPTAYDDVDAFIVKYSKPQYNSENIALRLLSYSMATVDHIHPKSKNGANHLYNYVPECMRCNSFRSDKPMIYQLEDYPEMFVNSQKLYDKLIGFANKGKLSKNYIVNLYKGIKQESEGVLQLDYSKLEMSKSLERELKKPFTYPVNPDSKNAILNPEPLPEPEALSLSFKDEQPKAKGNEEQVFATKPVEIKQAQRTESEIMNISPLITKRRRKRQVGEEQSPQIKKSAETLRAKKPRVQQKETIKRNNRH